MSADRPIAGWSIERKLGCAYAAAAVLLLAILAVVAPTAEAWFWRAILVGLFLAVSLRSALVWAYRRNPSQLNWWLRPTPVVENEFTITWLVYAVAFAAFSLLPLFI